MDLPPEVYINNQALEGFVEFFKKQDCLSECAHCGYCQKIADKAVELDSTEVNKYVLRLENSLNDLTKSKVSYLGSRP